MSERGLARVARGIALLCFGMVLASVPLLYLDRSAIYSFNADFSTLFPALTYAALGGLVASRRPRNPIGWLMLAIAVGTAAAAFGLSVAVRAQLAGTSPDGWIRWPTWFSNMNNVPIGALVLLFLLFPDGKALNRRWRWATWLTIAVSIGYLVGSAFDPAPVRLAPHLPAVGNPIGVNVLRGFRDSWVFLLLLILFVVGLVSLILRARRSRGDERQQLKWFVYAVGFSVGLAILALLASFVSEPVGNALFDVAFTFGFALVVPGAAAVAILKYGLYEIDVVINKAVVYVTLAAISTAIYVAIVVGIGSLVGSRGNVSLSILATAVVAVAFQPFRERSRRFADRLVYGKRATPYEILGEFASRVGGTLAAEDVLAQMAQTLAQGTGAARADVWLIVGDELRDEAVWPVDAPRLEPLRAVGEDLGAIGADLAVPVRHAGEMLGAISITKRPGEALTPTGSRLATDLASQAGLVLRNVRLVEDLRASRQRLVIAQDEERRKIERNLHDGAQQQLVALAVKLNLAGALVGTDGERERAIIEQLKSDAADALDNLRDLARGIYPPVLADQGLTAALRAQARKAPIPVSIEGDGIARYRPETEAAVYFSCLEGLQNVAKYADATRATVRLAHSDGTLRFEIADDGRGFDDSVITYGTGLQGIADRLAALGGTLEVTSAPGRGTTIAGTVPVVRAAFDG